MTDMADRAAAQQLAARSVELQRLGRPNEAAVHLRAAASLPALPTSDRAALWSDYGIALNQAGRRPEAISAYGSALALAPSHGRAYNNLAVALQAYGSVGDAHRAYVAAARLLAAERPEVPLNMLRNALDGASWRDWQLMEWAAASPAAQAAGSQMRPASLALARLEARVFLVGDRRLIHEAAAAEVAALETAALRNWSCLQPEPYPSPNPSSNPNSDAEPSARARLPAMSSQAKPGQAKPSQAKSSQAKSSQAKSNQVTRLALRAVTRPLRVVLLSNLDADPAAALLRTALPLLHSAGAVHVALLSTSPQPSIHTYIHAYIHPSIQVHVTLLSTSPHPSSHLLDITQTVPTIHLPATPLGLQPSEYGLYEQCDAADALSTIKPHVLLEVQGHLSGSVLLTLLARSATRAPVQASWMRAFHGSMRASFIHHAYTDARSLPPAVACEFTERLTLLPNQHLVSSHRDRPSSRRDRPSSRRDRPSSRRDRPSSFLGRGLRQRRPLVCSLNRVNKLEPTAVDTWSSLLRRTSSPLWIATGAKEWTERGTHETQRNLWSEGEARGLPPAALAFEGRAPSSKAYLQRVRRCALAVDTLRWGAHTTALDGMWEGVGTLGTPGDTLAARSSHSISHAAGVPACLDACIHACMHACMCACVLVCKDGCMGVRCMDDALRLARRRCAAAPCSALDGELHTYIHPYMHVYIHKYRCASALDGEPARIH